MIITALEPFGMEVTEIDLMAPVSPLAEELARTISAARVIVFRNQAIDDTGFIRFLNALGELTFTEGETPVIGAPDLNVVSNLGRATPPRSVFHSDTSYVRQPPSFTALRAVLLPKRGGATLFSDQVGVATRLPAKVREWLRGRSVLHKGGTVNGLDVEHRHPLLRRHPVTNEVSLYLSTPERCADLSDVDERTSTRIINALYKRSTQPRRLYRHEWRAGDVVVWDNRVTMHRADHDNVAGDRVLHRGMVGGEVPLGE